MIDLHYHSHRINKDIPWAALTRAWLRFATLGWLVASLPNVSTAQTFSSQPGSWSSGPRSQPTWTTVGHPNPPTSVLPKSSSLGTFQHHPQPSRNADLDARLHPFASTNEHTYPGSFTPNGDSRQSPVQSHASIYADGNYANTSDVRLASSGRSGDVYTSTYVSAWDRRRQDEAVMARYSIGQIQNARYQADQYRLSAPSQSPILADVALENARFVDEWAELASSFQSLVSRVNDAKQSLEFTTRDFDEVRDKLEQYGLTTTVGLLLQNKREQLSQWTLDQTANRFADQELNRTRQQQLRLEMLRFSGADPVGQTAQYLTEARFTNGIYPDQTLAAQLQEQFRQRGRWVAALKQGYLDYQYRLSELDSVLNEQTQVYARYRTLIDRKIIWVRNGESLGLAHIAKINNGYESLFSSQRSAELGYALKRKWDANPMNSMSLLLWTLLLLIARWSARRTIISIGGRQWMRHASKDSRKAVVACLTLVAAGCIPGIFYLFARWLGDGLSFEATMHASHALYAAALVALLVEVPRQLLNNYGLVDKHIAVELPRRPRSLVYMTLIGAGLIMSAYLVTMLNQIDHGLWRDSAGRATMIASLLLVSWTFHLALRPKGGAMEPLIEALGGSLIHRIRYAVYLVAVLFPIVMIMLLSLGYSFTVNQLTQRAIFSFVGALAVATLWTSLKVLAANGWLHLTGTAPVRRYDAYGQIPEDRSSEKQVAGVLAEHNLELKHQLAFLCQCALAISIVVSLGWLWIDVFPNLRLGNPVVWTVQQEMTDNVMDASGQPITRSWIDSQPITALHLVAAVATLFVAFQLARLLPGLLDALILQRVSYDEAMEHFLLVSGRCILFGIGCFIACQSIGLQWQTVQWLAVGLAIGVGYGLQDIVRNLLGGLIVLFEKPARLGDLITIGRVTGRVASQKFRTTTVADAEGREIIIPNKNFVSEEVVQWMGSGRLKSVRFEVAVKRDQRPADLCRMLQQLVVEQPDVLLTPAPQATLVCVSKESQRIEVQAWIEDNLNDNRFRDNLLREALAFLRDKEWLAPTQPSQPTLPEPNGEASDSLLHRSLKRSSKRSA